MRGRPAEKCATGTVILGGLYGYRNAAEQGDASAQFLLGAEYADGGVMPRDDAESVKWYRKAAGQGDASAQNNLGIAYLKGIGVPQDIVAAYKWVSLAADQGLSQTKQGDN